MNFDGALHLARTGELYPGVILHGGTPELRRAQALTLARALLCAEAPEQRPCGRCTHCRRMVVGEGELFHPDFLVLERDLKASTSVDATKAFLKGAQVSPFEARGQVFVVASAESLTPEAANALLKTLEEPPLSAPRHFLLLAPSQLDLLPTVRSRCLAVYLGNAAELPAAALEQLTQSFAHAVGQWAATGAPVWLLLAASALEAAGDWKDPRDGRPWAVAAKAVATSARSAPGLTRGLLELAEALLAAPELRLRGITAPRILEGLVSKHLAAGLKKSSS